MDIKDLKLSAKNPEKDNKWWNYAWINKGMKPNNYYVKFMIRDMKKLIEESEKDGKDCIFFSIFTNSDRANARASEHKESINDEIPF